MPTVQDRQLNLITHSLPTKMINAAVFLPEEFVMPQMNTPIDSQQFRFFFVLTTKGSICEYLYSGYGPINKILFIAQVAITLQHVQKVF